MYVTDYYSIENHLVSSDLLICVWRHLLKQGEDGTLALKMEFEESLKMFYKLVLPIMAWILFHRRAGAPLNLSNIRLRRLIRMDTDFQVRYTKKKLFHELGKTCGVATGTWPKGRKALEKELNALEPKTFVRGKFELWFFVQFIQRVIEGHQKASKEVGSKKLKVHLNLTSENAIQILCARAKMSSAFHNFLLDNLVSSAGEKDM